MKERAFYPSPNDAFLFQTWVGELKEPFPSPNQYLNICILYILHNASIIFDMKRAFDISALTSLRIF